MTDAQQVLEQVRVLFSRCGLLYTLEQLEVMRKRQLAVFHYAVNTGIKQFDTSLHKVSRMSGILSIGRRQGEPDSKISFVAELDFVVVLENTITPDFITKTCKALETPVTGDSLEARLYQLVDQKHVKPLKIDEIYLHNKTVNNCLILNHEKKMAYFASDIPRMISEIGNVVNYKGKIPTASTNTVMEKIAYIKKKSEEFLRELHRLSEEYPPSTIVTTVVKQTSPPPKEKNDEIDVFALDEEEEEEEKKVPMEVEEKKKGKDTPKKVEEKKKKKKKSDKKEKKKKEKKGKKKEKKGKKTTKPLPEVEEKKKVEKKRVREEVTHQKEEEEELKQGREKVQKKEIVESPVMEVIVPLKEKEEPPVIVEEVIVPTPMVVEEKKEILRVVEEEEMIIVPLEKESKPIILTKETPFEQKMDWFKAHLSQLQSLTISS